MIRQCAVCGADFKTYPSKIKIGRGKYCSKECCLSVTNKVLEKNGMSTRFVKGQKAHNFKGKVIHPGKGTDYYLVHLPGHPNCTASGYVREHRVLMENVIGRYLTKDEVVHHRDGDGLNNDINNLEIMTKAEHRRHHLKDNVHRRWQ